MKIMKMKKLLFLLLLIPNISQAWIQSAGNLIYCDTEANKPMNVSSGTIVLTLDSKTLWFWDGSIWQPIYTSIVSGTNNSGLTSTEYHPDKITTTNSTPVLISSIPIPPHKRYYMRVFYIAIKGDESTANSGFVNGTFGRVSGNLSQDGTITKDLQGVLSNAQISFVLNNTTHAVDIYANGLSATTINWYFNLWIKYIS